MCILLIFIYKKLILEETWEYSNSGDHNSLWVCSFLYEIKEPSRWSQAFKGIDNHSEYCNSILKCYLVKSALEIKFAYFQFSTITKTTSGKLYDT